MVKFVAQRQYTVEKGKFKCWGCDRIFDDKQSVRIHCDTCHKLKKVHAAMREQFGKDYMRPPYFDPRRENKG